LLAVTFKRCDSADSAEPAILGDITALGKTGR
jgi:hypothetical protein